MKIENETFFASELPGKLRQLSSDQKPEWGILNPQAMVEHLTGSWRISNGRVSVKQNTTPEEAEQYKSIILSDEPMAPNTKNPVMPENETPALKKPDLKSAIDQLEDEIQAFFAYFRQYPYAKPVHPLLGPISQQEWLKFQTKHVKHHLRQFNLIENLIL